MAETSSTTNTSMSTSVVNIPRITIKYCTQCKWMLRAAYFAQELLSTFSTQIGEIALIPATGGIFTVTLIYAQPNSVDDVVTTQETILWDRKTEGGFPEVKQLKSLVRNIIDPTKSLGHTDRALAKQHEKQKEAEDAEPKRKIPSISTTVTATSGTNHTSNSPATTATTLDVSRPTSPPPSEAGGVPLERDDTVESKAGTEDMTQQNHIHTTDGANKEFCEDCQ